MSGASNNLGFFVRSSLDLDRCVLVKFRVSVFISLECMKVGEGWLRSQAWRWAGSMSSQSRGSSISDSDYSESKYSSVEEMYGSRSWVCCWVSVENGC